MTFWLKRLLCVSYKHYVYIYVCRKAGSQSISLSLNRINLRFSQRTRSTPRGSLVTSISLLRILSSFIGSIFSQPRLISRFLESRDAWFYAIAENTKIIGERTDANRPAIDPVIHTGNIFLELIDLRWSVKKNFSTRRKQRCSFSRDVDGAFFTVEGSFRKMQSRTVNQMLTIHQLIQEIMFATDPSLVSLQRQSVISKNVIGMRS